MTTLASTSTSSTSSFLRSSIASSHILSWCLLRSLPIGLLVDNFSLSNSDPAARRAAPASVPLHRRRVVLPHGVRCPVVLPHIRGKQQRCICRRPAAKPRRPPAGPRHQRALSTSEASRSSIKSSSSARPCCTFFTSPKASKQETKKGSSEASWGSSSPARSRCTSATSPARPSSVEKANKQVYALTKERDTLKREQNKKSDAAALLKEKDEIISQVMAEGEELSKKQAAQEATIRKLRAQIRELEEEKQRTNSKIQEKEVEVSSVARESPAPTLPAACLDTEVVVRVTCTCGVHKEVSFDHCH